MLFPPLEQAAAGGSLRLAQSILTDQSDKRL
jgi:hypothetical protein